MVQQYVTWVLQSGDRRPTAQSLMVLVREILRRGCMVISGTGRGGAALSESQEWLINVEWVWQCITRELGPLARHVVLLRLTRPQKTVQASFVRIAEEITDMARATWGGWRDDEGQELELSTAGAEALYRAALSRFAELIEQRKLSVPPRSVDVVAGAMATSCYPVTDVKAQRTLIASGLALQRFAVAVRRRQQRDLLASREGRRHDVSHGARV